VWGIGYPDSEIKIPYWVLDEFNQPRVNRTFQVIPIFSGNSGMVYDGVVDRDAPLNIGDLYPVID
jgi:hypothetical protein